jgi:hypothetical protein
VGRLSFHCPSFPELELDLNALFEFPIAPEEQINVVREGRPPPHAAKQGG